jgi:hypothetical protein
MRSNWFIRANWSLWPAVVWRGYRDWSPSWAAAYNFVVYWSTYDQGEGYWYGLNPAATFTPATRSDAYLYDWGRGGGWSHLALAMGATSAGDKLVQHSRDRWGDYWNIGYRTENDPVVRSRMKASYLKVLNGW